MRIDLHCHSTFSDGALAPDALADRLASSGVAFAALSDHDTVDGLSDFARAAARRGLGCVAGLEMTVQCHGREGHLLAYGFDPSHPELQATLRSLRQIHQPGVHGIAHSIRRAGSGIVPATQAEAAGSAAPHGHIDIADAVAVVHRAGGLAFLAHPLIFQPDMGELKNLLGDLKARRLDGIEALYGPFDRRQRESLCALAAQAGLLVCAGTDVHDPASAGRQDYGIDVPSELWKPFRDALSSRTYSAQAPAESRRHQPYRVKRRQFIFHIVFPAVLAMVLFVAVIFAVFLPTLERSLLDRKREMIRELTNSAWSILAEVEREERAGLLSREKAQQQARTRVESLRYGREGKDYFWLQDMHPNMVMHPYRSDLNGRDVSDFRDPRGIRIFVEFADLVRRKQEGYIEYVWQWKDDPRRLVPKESYIKGFAPWGWIIGTGIYIEDVKQEIARIERNLVWTSLAVSAVVVLLLLYVMRESLRLERDRSQAQESLHESTERYRSLVEAATEGTLLVVDGRCRYANPTLLAMLGCSQRQLELLDLSEVIPDQEGNQAAWRNIRGLLDGQEPAGGFEGSLRRLDGASVECVLSLSRIAFAGRNGLILLAKDVQPQHEAGRAGAGNGGRLRHLAQVADAVKAGIFRARATRQGPIMEANAAALDLLRLRRRNPAEPALFLADLFAGAGDFDDLLRQLNQDGAAERQLCLWAQEARTQVVSLRAVLVRDEHQQPRFIDGVLQDITQIARREAERESIVEKLQTSLLFLHLPVGNIGRAAVFCPFDAPINKAAALMTAQASTAILVQSQSGADLGIVTDRDLRERVMTAGIDAAGPVHTIMSSPLAGISHRAAVCEAMGIMQEKGLQHLAVTDDDGRITSILHSSDLLQFPSHGAIAISHEIARATQLDDVVRSCRRTPGLARSLLDSGAHPRNITRLVASVCDAATERLLALAQAELGPPPAPFAFLALGSQGRQEQTLFTDQDNAIVYSIAEGDAASAQAAAYFCRLGAMVCDGLDKAGYPFCRGDVMAKNPKWCLPLHAWKQCFTNWIQKAEPKELLEFSIFFDFRAVCGEAQLAMELRSHVHQELRGCPAFFPHFAQNSLLFKPPMRLFGRIVGGGGAGPEHSGELNLKDAMMPIVSFARLYALRHEVGETNTLGRLDVLASKGALLESTREEVAIAYDSMMRLRLRQQIAAIQAGQAPDNFINHRRLGHIEEAMLKQSFVQTDAVQKKISYDFLGGT